MYDQMIACATSQHDTYAERGAKLRWVADARFLSIQGEARQSAETTLHRHLSALDLI